MHTYLHVSMQTCIHVNMHTNIHVNEPMDFCHPVLSKFITGGVWVCSHFVIARGSGVMVELRELPCFFGGLDFFFPVLCCMHLFIHSTMR